MKKLTKNFSIMLIAVVLCFSTLFSVFADATIPEATPDFYVNDFANIFTSDEKTALMNNAVKLANETNGVQLVISTVESLEGDTVENYALNMYNKYGVGKGDMGLLILLSTGDRQIRVEVGRAMEGYINDSKAGRFIDKYAIPYLKDNRFNEGLVSLQGAFIEEIRKCVLSEKKVPSTDSSLPDFDFSIILGALGILALLALLIYIIWLIVRKIKKRKALITNLNEEVTRLKNENSKLKEFHNSEKSELNKIISALRQNVDSSDRDLSKTKTKLTNLEDRHNRILKIYPDADVKVDEMLREEQIQRDKTAAKKVDSLIATVISLNASKNIVDKLESVLYSYNNLSDEQKQYVTSDISKLKLLYNNCIKLKNEYEKKVEEERIRKLTEQRKNKANSVTKQILAVISSIGIARAHDLYELNDAKDLYDDLDSETQKYVDDSVISKLDSLISAAKRDKEEEEDRRRRASYSSSYRSSSSSSRSGGFGGFGGRSGGGGASRGF